MFIVPISAVTSVTLCFCELKSSILRSVCAESSHAYGEYAFTIRLVSSKFFSTTACSRARASTATASSSAVTASSFCAAPEPRASSPSIRGIVLIIPTNWSTTPRTALTSPACDGANL